MMRYPTSDRVRALLEYDPLTGVFLWRPRQVYDFRVHGQAEGWNEKFAGEVAGSLSSDGYRYIGIDGERCSEHRLAWLYCYGFDPEKIDHENGITDDNRLQNLRSTTVQGNARNQKRRKDNKSGVTGVSWDAKTSKWLAYIYVDYRLIRLGRFDRIENATAARKAAEKKYTFHPNHGRAA